MKWHQMQGSWKVCRGALREKWGYWIHDDSQIVRGKRQQLLGKLQARYGIFGADVETQVDEFLGILIAKVLQQENTADREPEHRADKS
ncbi:MAG TPA: hypothetical protein VMU53_17295 [Candidatus Sulfotelmatobacter sp.]|nr:hypothetical protein [Candidatus Sulfotelmatobacter sp.]